MSTRNFSTFFFFFFFWLRPSAMEEERGVETSGVEGEGVEEREAAAGEGTIIVGWWTGSCENELRWKARLAVCGERTKGERVREGRQGERTSSAPT